MKNLTINGKSYEMPSDQTNLVTIKKVIKSIANARSIAAKDVKITLPNGKLILFKDLNSIKDIVVENNAGIYATAPFNDNSLEMVRKLDWLTAQTHQTPLDFSKLGSRKIEDFVEISENTQKRLIDNAIKFDGVEIDDNFQKLISE